MRGAVFSALLLVLAHPPFFLFPLPFLALVPLAMALVQVPATSTGRVRAALLGLVFGLTFWGFSLIWVPVVVAPFFGWAYSGYLVLLVLLGGLSGLFGWLTHRLSREKGLSLGLALPLAWVGVEWVKAHFPFGLAFPWLGLGVTLAEWPRILGVAEWVGETGVSFWIAGANGLIASVVLAPDTGTRLRRSTVALGVVLLPQILGVVRARTLTLEEGPTVLVVGTEVPPGLRGDPEGSAKAALAQIERNLADRPPSSFDLIVLPEATLPFPLDSPEAAGPLGSLSSLASRWHAPVVFGGLGRAPPPDPGSGLTNAVFLLGADGRLADRYDKARLVPGMERGRYRPGPGGKTLFGDGLMVGPLLCYESLFGNLARKSRRAGARLLVNLSSDIWFGKAGSILGSAFLRQHPSHLVLRAVENRMPVARAANGGFSFLLDPLGRIVSETVPPTGGVTSASLGVYRGRTLFDRTGDWVGPGAILACLMVLFSPGRRREGTEG